jgi:DNA polymerase elongation subunit (family B)
MTLLDIETDSSDGFPDIEKADKEITAISLSRKGEKVVFGFYPYTPKDPKVTYIHCEDEYSLLEKFLKVWQSGRFLPDVITGWNVEFFDIPYIVNRITNILGKNAANKLSPWGILENRTIEFKGKEIETYTPAGISVLDYYHLYKKFSFTNQESYKLDHIAEQELGENKLDYSEYGSLHGLYVNNFEKFIDYNIHDTTLVDRLEEKLGFIELVFAFAYDAKVNFSDTFTTVRPWDIIIHNYLLDRAIVIPQFNKSTMDKSLVGGYVKEPKIGLSKWVVSFDLNSLYPHLIMQYNISPETLIGKEEFFPGLQSIIDGYAVIEGSHAVAANGTKYRKDKQGFLPALMQKMYNDRSEYKKKMIAEKKKLETLEKGTEEYRQTQNLIARYHNLQLAKKIQLNSAYGALGNEYFRWFNFDMAEAITTSGQLSIRWVERHINEYMNKLLKTNNFDYIIASDTDSIYINLEPLVNTLGDKENIDIVKIIDTFCEQKIQKVINKAYEDLAIYMNAFEQKMFMKRETIANKGIWRGKKMYILNALDIEGVRFTEPVIKMQGIEAVRSSTPKACRKNIKKALQIIMNDNEESIQRFVQDFREEFMKLPFEDIAFPRGMNNLTKYRDSKEIYKERTPIHVKGALIYNNLLTKHNLERKYQSINDGDKIKFAYLKPQNPFHDTVISILDEVPSELGILKYIDYDMQFKKSFVDPITSILDVIGWSVEKTNNLEDFFQ